MKILTILSFILFFNSELFAQNLSIEPDRGILIPKMSTVTRNSVASPASGLMIYNTDSNKFNYYDGTSWQEASSGNQWATNGSHISYSNGQVGIGISTPTAPLSFASTPGNKIALWGDANGAHYGFGIQGGLLQMYANQPSDNISFGSGSSNSFNERMTIYNTGGEGMLLKGRITLRNGTVPNNPAYGPGVWLYRGDNTAPLGFMGTQNNQNIGFYGGTREWGFTYDAVNSRVGIANHNPNAPLAFGPYLEKKITLYPGATGDVGFAVGGNQLKIYSDNPNAQVSLGYDAAGVFTDRFSVKANGAIAVNGNMGNNGQVLTSKGANAIPEWKIPYSFYNNIEQKFQSAIVEDDQNGGGIDLPNMTHTFTVTGNAKLLLTFNIDTESVACFACGFSRGSVQVFLNDVYQMSFTENIPNGEWATISGTYLATVGAGTHTIKLNGVCIHNPLMRFWGSNAYSNMIVQLINE
ncbi:hypothetical protein EGI26_19335 [Lacihabitans sp. CCS-44]|uniref:hypothetical protein n=1 Tax=Lacihabitans sp. CCS-44 TaxID=2487331 RepID=UPI0020CF1372|nr:hypothetical protein [Lacihabitans sp. CCS-44]MCP9757320.1 hypothetical protein [Lacihabitans sp. CCS-44]